MVSIIFFTICFLASIAGAICGIGGGVIIKPALDSFHIMDVAVISFLSGCTVLSMSTYSVLKSKSSSHSHLDSKISFPLAAGSAVGGLLGKWLFTRMLSLFPDSNQAGAVQTLCLLIITIGTLFYTLYKEKIPTHRISGKIPCLSIGLFLGILSSFLGIGGGPINLIVLFFFFSMDTKAAAENSLYIILFSQITSLLSSIVNGTIPEFNLSILILMTLGGICGGICGRLINRHISDKTVEKLFLSLMILIIGINFYNMFVFTRA